VRARPDTIRYRTSKFVQRHRIGVGAATLVAATLVGAVVVTTREARARTLEADRAQRQVGQIRRLASTMLVDLHDAVADVPGATGARELIVVTAQRYLTALASDTGDDPSLQFELAESYRKIGDVQFEWEPSTPSVAVHLSGRGTDVRLERTDRVGATERKEARRIRREGSDEFEDDLDAEE